MPFLSPENKPRIMEGKLPCKTAQLLVGLNSTQTILNQVKLFFLVERIQGRKKEDRINLSSKRKKCSLDFGIDTPVFSYTVTFILGKLEQPISFWGKKNSR